MAGWLGQVLDDLLAALGGGKPQPVPAPIPVRVPETPGPAEQYRAGQARRPAPPKSFGE